MAKKPNSGRNFFLFEPNLGSLNFFDEFYLYSYLDIVLIKH